jgi:hypothetical protein
MCPEPRTKPDTDGDRGAQEVTCKGMMEGQTRRQAEQRAAEGWGGERDEKKMWGREGGRKEELGLSGSG